MKLFNTLTRNVEEFINNGLLDLDGDDAHGVSKEDLDELAEIMKNRTHIY